MFLLYIFAGISANNNGTATPPYFYVDINGAKGPNETSQYSKKVNDQFYFKIYQNKVIPGRYPHSVEPQIMYGQK